MKKIKYKINEPDKDGNIKMPEKSNFEMSKQLEDNNGVICNIGCNGEIYYNIASVTSQAMNCYNSLDTFSDNLIKNKNNLSNVQLRAYDWLDKNKHVMINGAYIWYNNFDINYNNILIFSPWQSAFSQSKVIHSYIVAYKVTKNLKYLEYANKAALSFEISVNDGGLTSKINNYDFYEEVPLSNKYSPHILNGHLYSTVILKKLSNLKKDLKIQRLTDSGIESTKKLWSLFDQGYWTRYDLSPRLINIPMKIQAQNSKENINVINAEFSDNYNNTRNIELNINVDEKGHLFEINLPGTVPDNYLNSKYKFKITYNGIPTEYPLLGILGFRENIKEYYKLNIINNYKSGKYSVVEYEININDLAWSTLSEFYMQWHILNIKKLYEETRDKIFFEILNRWNNYLKQFHKDKNNFNKENKLNKKLYNNVN